MINDRLISSLLQANQEVIIYQGKKAYFLESNNQDEIFNNWKKTWTYFIDIWKRKRCSFSYSIKDYVCITILTWVLSALLYSLKWILYSTFSYRLNVMHSMHVNMSYFGFISLENIAFIYRLKRVDRSPLLYDLICHYYSLLHQNNNTRSFPNYWRGSVSFAFISRIHLRIKVALLFAVSLENSLMSPTTIYSGFMFSKNHSSMDWKFCVTIYTAACIQRRYINTN